MKMLQMYGVGGFGPPSLEFMNKMNAKTAVVIPKKKPVEAAKND
jgi:hypothetical protein